MTRFTITEFHKQYKDDDACLEEVFRHRYGTLEICPFCKRKTRFYRVRDRKCYSCQLCGFQLHPLADTIFHKSDTKLTLWFYAIFLFANSKNGVSAKELERQLGVTYKTAWRMAKQIRLLCRQTAHKLGHTVEMDETYLGGYKRGKAGRGSENKSPVVGLVERGGRVVAKITPNVTRHTMAQLIFRHIRPGATLMTDEYNAYPPSLGLFFRHHRVKHSKKEFVRGTVHTNTIEGFWSQLKRSLSGTYHDVSPKYLQTYVDEFAYRYSKRSWLTSLFFPMLSRAVRPVG